jgi:hypothetical protein
MITKEQEKAPEVTDRRQPEEAPVEEKPSCPGCGWSNIRPSIQHSTLDLVLEAMGLRAFRCRSCGKRFRRFQHRKR